MLNANLGEFKPKRIGHLDLIGKFKTEFPNTTYPEKTLAKIFSILDKENYSLDFNMNGLSVKTRTESYLTNTLVQLCKDYKVKVVYGSDAHGIQRVGQFYSEFEKESQSL